MPKDLFIGRWAMLGLMVFLVGPWFVPDNKLYHQLIIVFLWLPALLACIWVKSYPANRLGAPEWLLYFLLGTWTLVVAAIHAGSEWASDLKLPFYVALFLAGISLSSRLGRSSFENALFWASLICGLGALCSWIDFYWIDARPFNHRLSTIGLWDTPIPAANAVGALAVVGFFLRGATRWSLPLRLLCALAALGYLVFLGFSQTRGVWAALIAVVTMSVIIQMGRRGLPVVVGLAAVGALLIWLFPDVLLQRGLSYRPQLWAGGLDLLMQHPLLGVGFERFTVEILVSGRPQEFLHPHNLFLDTAIRLGVLGLVLFLGLWGVAVARAWVNRDQPLGKALLALLVFSTVSLLTDGIGLWLKPNATWLITWLPIAISLVLARGESIAAKDTPAGKIHGN